MKYFQAAAQPLRHWGLHNEQTGAVEWLAFVDVWFQKAQICHLNLGGVNPPNYERILDFLIFGADKAIYIYI